MKAQGFFSRARWIQLFLLLSALALIAEVVLIAPTTLAIWHPYDYWRYTEIGLHLR